jgi:hypothetical protein
LFENLRRHRLLGHLRYPHTIPSPVLVGEPEMLSRFDAQAGSQMMAEITGEGDLGFTNIR